MTATHRYRPASPSVSFPALEEETLAFWERERIFEKSVESRPKEIEGASNEFVFYDGPPFATGLPHFGHFIPSTIKDIIGRYKTMKGLRVERRWGWDCHGLPIETLIEKELGLKSKADIEKMGVAKFNAACRESVLRYTAEWRRVINRLGRWVDFDRDYKTMDAPYMESIWHVIRALHDKERLYEGHYILPYCPRCATVLSNHELSLGGYKDVNDPAVTIRFKVTSNKFDDGGKPVYFLAWTTTPWTLPSNLALCVGEDIDYALIEVTDEEFDGKGGRYIIAASRLGAYFKEGAYKTVASYKGGALKGMKYEPLFPYFADAGDAAFRVYTGSHVTTEDGTGIVHTAPGFGEDDARVLKGSGVPTICPVDEECRFTKDVPDYAGRFVKECDKDIMERLQREGRLVKRAQILHAYPHCWRCGSPLIYRAVSSWFVAVEKIKPALLAANAQINWQPAHIKEGRFGKWLEGARDWAISRNRYWGNPLPIWKCDTCGKTHVVGSRAELQELSGVYPEDLHKEFVDKITFPCSNSNTEAKSGACNGTMKRVSEVLDCWFESGAMPYAQNHYPFENKDFFERHFPADFINEGLDQTRGWFYTLTVLSAALFDKPAFKNCIVSGIVLASDGKKMSKSLHNYTDPMEIVNKFGADALRLFLINSAAVEAESLRYTDRGVEDVLKSIILPLWNAYSFFVTYANIDGYAEESAAVFRNPLDAWLVSACQTLCRDVGGALEAYDLSRAVPPLLAFIDSLNNWYIRRSRRRFWRPVEEDRADKIEGYAALLYALKTLALAASPFMPFTTEAIWQNLRSPNDAESVHLAPFPTPSANLVNEELEYKMSAAQKAVRLGRALRSAANIKNRQPLASAVFVSLDKRERAVLEETAAIIAEELNVKTVRIGENEDTLVTYEARANFRVLGKELGKDMKSAGDAIASLSQDEIKRILQAEKPFVLQVNGREVALTSEKLDIRRIEKEGLRVLNEGSVTCALDTTLTPALLDEGYARDLIRGIQTLRKERGFEVTDRIRLTVSGSAALRSAWDAFKPLIMDETLSVEAVWQDGAGGTAITAGGLEWRVGALTIAILGDC